jgi:GMP synthase-like glutamine amidotransferase
VSARAALRGGRDWIGAVDICVIEQEPEAPAGLLADWALERGHRVAVLRAREVTRWPDPREFGLIVPLGSECSVHASPDAWIPTQIDFLRRAHEAGVPVFGICFGAQALAAALGAEVRRAAAPEIGWIEVEPLNGGNIAPGPWIVWHGDTFAFPEGAEPLARTAAAPHAFRLGNSVGVQFHPEVTAEILDMWIHQGRAQLDAGGIDPDAMRRQLVADEGPHRDRAFALFDAIVAGWTSVQT